MRIGRGPLSAPIGAVLFDLDCTLYPPECGLLAEIDRNITQFIEHHLSLPHDEADALRRAYFDEFGTTIRGLHGYHGSSVVDYYAAVYDLDPFQYVSADPRLADLLGRLQATRAIFTNGTAPYAQRVLEALGVADLFVGIFDIVFAGYDGKPNESFYRAVAEELRLPLDQCLVVDDLRRNVAAGCRLGMPGIWVDWYQTAPCPCNDVDLVLRSVYELPEAVPWLFS